MPVAFKGLTIKISFICYQTVCKGLLTIIWPKLSEIKPELLDAKNNFYHPFTSECEQDA